MKLKRLLNISSEIPVASMSDIAFLLIVFFMIVAVFSLEAGFLLKLPAPDKPPLKVSDKKIIEVQIAEDNSLRLDNKPVTLETLGQHLDQISAGDNKFVSIKAHDKSRYQIAMLVIERFNRNGFEKISLKRLEP
ncbi:biopolymer transporter ExbD [bacterium]|nr:biopolymer transporter ExbD [bacterium]